jgi:5-methylcytosine-specific restriction endonuclease McrA
VSCIGCGRHCDRRAIRCITCSNKARGIPRQGCLDCGTPVVELRSLRCLPCHNKRQDRGLSRERTKFNLSEAWRVVRTACFKRDNWTCQFCYVSGGVLNAHHFDPWARYPERRLDLTNLVTVCRPCHLAIHFGEA